MRFTNTESNQPCQSAAVGCAESSPEGPGRFMINMPSYLKTWRRNNKPAIARYARSVRRSIRLEIIEFLGGKCAKCGFSDERALHIDHIHGGGSKEVAGGRLYSRWHRFIKSPTPDIYQVLCANCNEIKRREQMEQRRLHP